MSLALAIAPDPELLILDDPTLGLDTNVRRDFLESMIQIIQRRGRTILFSSHVLGDVERVADRVGTAEVILPHQPFRELRYLIAVLLPSPLVLDVVGVVHARDLHDDGRCPTFGSALVRTLTLLWPAALLAQLLSAALAVLCYRRQTRYGTSRTERIIWPLFVLLLGLPGWIGYRFGRSWPVLETCPECDRTVPRDREICVRCENEFPTPALKGTEVFA